jgi:DNA repair photolyase
LIEEPLEQSNSFEVLSRIRRRPLTVSPVFQQWLEQTFPEPKDKALGRIRSMYGGKLNDPRFGSRIRREGIFAEQRSPMFNVARRRAGFTEDAPELSTAHFRRPGGRQLTLALQLGK